jgi:hypothetical protein
VKNSGCAPAFGNIWYFLVRYCGRLVEPKEEELAGGCRTLHSDEVVLGSSDELGWEDRGMWNTRGRREMRNRSWWENLKKWEQLDDSGINWRITAILGLKKNYGRAWARFICLGLGTNGVLFWTRSRTFVSNPPPPQVGVGKFHDYLRNC